jgi:hypothetical protein
MKNVIIKNLDGVQTHGAEMEDPTQWIAYCVAQNVWGKPERWQEEYRKGESPSWVEPYDLADVIEEEDRPDPVSDDLIHWVKLRAEYTIEIQDITYEHDLDLCIAQRIAEYPDLGAFLNAFFDGGDAAIEGLRAQRLAVKAKYPKPVKTE